MCLYVSRFNRMFLGFNQRSVALTGSSQSYFFGDYYGLPDKDFWRTVSPVNNFQLLNLQYFTFREKSLTAC